MHLQGVNPVDIDAGKKVRENRIYRLGIELEGGWDKLPPGVHGLDHDGSVKGLPFCKYGTGELPSPPLEPSSYKEWMRKCYPDHVNETCGMHVHMSVRNSLTYQRLMDARYPATVIAYFRKWGTKVKLPKSHSLWDRLDGLSPYCKHEFTADEQVLNRDKDHNRERRGNRYTVMNYCWGRTGTVECRLLPAMPDVELAIEAIDELMAITNGFLVTTVKKEIKHRGEVLDNSREVRQVRDVRVRL